MDLKACYAAAGADYEDVMRRLMGEERVTRFLAMFLRDQSYDQLCAAMEAGRCDEAFRAVHTIKGISMNLSLTALRDACVALTENLRGGRTDGQTAGLYEQVRQEYGRTTGAIRAYLGQTGGV